MSSIHWSEVQTLNFSAIALVRDAARQDLAAACCRFGLNKAALETIGTMTHSELMALVERAGEELLFVPRDDLPKLLSAPSSVLRLLAAVPMGLARHAAASN